MIWADDILMLSESEDGLQRELNTLGVYCSNNKLSVNTDQTECMICKKTVRLMENKFFFNDTMIKNVRKYKYLGFLVTPSGEIKSGLKDLRIRSLKALTKTKSILGPLFRQNSHLYNHTIKPSDFWDCLKFPNNNPIERLHNMFCKLPKNNPIERFHNIFCKLPKNNPIERLHNIFCKLSKNNPIERFHNMFCKLPKNNPIERFHNMFCKLLIGVQKQTNTGTRYGPNYV